MEKRTIIILTIISTFISLVWTLCSYYGITRYLSCLFKTKCNIENYSKLPKASDDRVIISFTTTPDKMEKLKPFINSLLDQTVKVDLIALIITQSSNYELPTYLKDIVNVFPAGRNYGKGTKIIPMLLREKEMGTIIIAIDENRVYDQDFIYNMVEESKSNPDSVLIDTKGSVMLVKPEHFDGNVINRDQESFDNEWFLKNAKSKKMVDCGENYFILGF